MLVTRHADAIAVLGDPEVAPPPVPQDAPPNTLAWLRAQVCRFSSGEAHIQRRKDVEERLAALDPASLRSAASNHAELVVEALPTVVLGEALGFDHPGDLVPHVTTAAVGYLTGEDAPAADAAVAALMEMADIVTVTVLLQAQEATSSLTSKSLARDDGRGSVDDLLHETLRYDPPVPTIRRVGVDIDVSAANRDEDGAGRAPIPYLTFGYGERRCPAPAHALAIAAGYVEGWRRALR